MPKFIRTIFEAYGGFFLLDHPLTNLLLMVATLIYPNPSLCLMGLVGGLSTMAFRALLRFQKLPNNIEVVNGILVGLMMGASFAPGPKTIVLTVLSGLLVVVVSALFHDTVGRWLRLPLLGTSYVLVSYLLICLARVVGLSPLPLSSFAPASSGSGLEAIFLSAFGAIYFNPTIPGGLLVLAAIAISSPYLLLIGVSSAFLSILSLQFLGINSTYATYLIALMNGVLTAMVLGGLFGKPGRKSFCVALGGAVVTVLVSLATSSILWGMGTGLPALASPFLIVSYMALIVFNGDRGSHWSDFWLFNPSLPERSLERIRLAKVRGVTEESLALLPPVTGLWNVYQGFYGKYTHQVPWQFSLDLFKTVDGISHRNSGKELEDYYCFAASVVSPAYGIVVDLETTINDNPPASVDNINVWGNYLLIQLDYGGFLKLAHLKKGSIKVERGSRVIPGQIIAQCGNSGRSPQPHLHMHVQDSPDVANIQIRTRPFHLTSVVVQGASGEQVFQLFKRPEEGESFASVQINPALRKVLDLTVGTRLDFDLVDGIGRSVRRRLSVELDINGQFYLVSDSGARVAFVRTEHLLAFFDRSGPEDKFLDGFILAYSVTPFLDGRLNWEDAPSEKLLSGILHLRDFRFKFTRGAIKSSYRRKWDSAQKCWIQRAVHRSTRVSVVTEAFICESRGFGGFCLEVEGRIQLMATLAGKGMRSDNGVAEWYRDSVSV